ncbi:MAG: response regulator [Firmicutes bacterium]|nr:response regulator [Bacillota bacterium]
MRVRLVETSPFLRFLFREALRRAHHEIVAECTSLEEAVKLAGRLAPEVVVLDLEDGLTDWEARIQELVLHLPKSHLIVLGPSSGRPRNESWFAAYLEKPCSPQTVLTTIQSLSMSKGLLPV